MRSAVGYIRVSKPKQSRSGLGLEARQAKYLRCLSTCAGIFGHPSSARLWHIQFPCRESRSGAIR